MTRLENVTLTERSDEGSKKLSLFPRGTSAAEGVLTEANIQQSQIAVSDYQRLLFYRQVHIPKKNENCHFLADIGKKENKTFVTPPRP